MSRTYLYQALVDDADATALGSLGSFGLESSHIYAGDVDTPRGDYFLILRFGPMNRGMDTVNSQTISVWVYDRLNSDYDIIDGMLKRIRWLFEIIESQKTSEGHILEISWDGDSDDLSDDIYHAIARNASFTLVDSGR